MCFVSTIINNISATAERQHKVIYMVGDIKGPGGIKGAPRSTERTGTSSKPIIKKRSESPAQPKDTEQVSQTIAKPSVESLRDNFQKMQSARNIKEGLAEAIADINAFSPAGIKEGGTARSVGAALSNAKSNINSPFQNQVLDAIDGPKPYALEHQAPRTVKISA